MRAGPRRPRWAGVRDSSGPNFPSSFTGTSSKLVRAWRLAGDAPTSRVTFASPPRASCASTIARMVFSALRSTVTSVGSMGGVCSCCACSFTSPVGALTVPATSASRETPPETSRGSRPASRSGLSCSPAMRARAWSAAPFSVSAGRASETSRASVRPTEACTSMVPLRAVPFADTERLPFSGPSTSTVRSVGGSCRYLTPWVRAAAFRTGASAWPDRSTLSSAVPVTSALSPSQPRVSSFIRTAVQMTRARSKVGTVTRAFTGSCRRRRSASTGRSTSALSSVPRPRACSCAFARREIHEPFPLRNTFWTLPTVTSSASTVASREGSEICPCARASSERRPASDIFGGISACGSFPRSTFCSCTLASTRFPRFQPPRPIAWVASSAKSRIGWSDRSFAAKRRWVGASSFHVASG